MMAWQEKIYKGMKLIIEGCKENTEWRTCSECPFAELCDIIYEDSPSPYTTPDSYEEEGLFDEKQS